MGNNEKVVMSAAQDITVVTTCGDIDVSLSDEVKQFARLFYLKLHGNFDSNLDKARAHAFSTTKADLRCFHPTEDSFHYHMLRALSEFSFTKCSA